MNATLRERTEHAARYGANLVVSAREIKKILDERDQAEEWADEQSYPLVMRQGEVLTGVANALNGPTPPLTSWSHHDLEEKAKALVATLEAVRQLHTAGAGGFCGHCTRGRLYHVPAPCDTAAALAEGGDAR